MNFSFLISFSFYFPLFFVYLLLDSLKSCVFSCTITTLLLTYLMYLGYDGIRWETADSGNQDWMNYATIPLPLEE